MKIDKSSQPLPTPSVGEGKARAVLAKSGDNVSSAASSTNVSLGTTTAQLRSMDGSAATSPPVNAAKVAEIKRAISEGRFQVNSSAVADSLIKSVTDLISAQKA